MPDRQAATAPGQARPTRPEPVPLAFHALTFQPDGDEVAVGRLETGEFAVLPADGAALLRQLVNGAPPPDAAAWYERTYGESVDIADFVADLGELGFLRPPGEAPAPPPAPVRWQRLGRVVFSWGGAVVYGALIAAWVVTLVRSPELAPSYQHLFFTRYLSVIVLTMFFAQAPMILLHEAAHALAGRALGLPSKLSIGRRLYYVVFQTTMDGLVAVPRRKRVLPILAGMLTDVALLAALTLFAAVTRGPGGTPSLAGGIALGLCYATLLRLVWQCFFFLQTDVYYLVVTVLGCVDLQNTAKHMLANRWCALRGRPPQHDPDAWHPRDRAAARWYAPLMALGYLFALVALALNVPPVVTRAVRTVVDQLSSGAHHLSGVADSLLFLLLVVGELALAAVLYLRERARRRAAAARPTSAS